MPIYLSDNYDPYVNLAIEEVLFRDRYIQDDIFMVWQNTPAFVFGRNQNPYLEICPEYLNKSIPVIRRISGGGTVYQDLRTINFSYITNDYKNKVNKYKYFLLPVIEALNNFGLDVKFKSKSDLVLKNKKISGNAQAFSRQRLLHHGTILYDSDLHIINQALVMCRFRGEDYHVKSNRQEVTNIKPYLPKDITMEDVVKRLVETVVKARKIDATPLVLSDIQKQEVKHLVEQKYQSFEWNFAKSQTFNIYLPFKAEEVRLSVEDGMVTNVNDDRFKLLEGETYASLTYMEKLKSIFK